MNKIPKINLSETVERVLSDCNDIIMEKKAQIAQLQAELSELSTKIESFARYVESLPDSSDRQLVGRLSASASLSIHSQMTIGDAIEVIIRQEGPKTQSELIKRIKEAGIRISSKAPYVVIKNSILRDKRKRFRILSDRKIDLATTKIKPAHDHQFRKRSKSSKSD